MNNSTPSPKKQISVEVAIVQERLRQARYSFNLALIATGISACVGLVGAGLLLYGKLSEGVITASSGLASGVCCVRLAKDSNDRLDRILAELND
jgi:CHASE2 domain-containing sensor protein